MSRQRTILAPKEDPEHVAARRALKVLVKFKLGVARESHGRREAVASALVVIGSAADALTAAIGSAGALDLLEEFVSNLRDQASRRSASKRNGGAS